MAPGGGGGKRKRGAYAGDGRDDIPRASPHKPGDLALGQHVQGQGYQSQGYGRNQYEQRGGGRRRASRGGRGGGPQHSPVHSPHATPTQPHLNNASPKLMSPSIPPASESSTAPRSDSLFSPAAHTSTAIKISEQTQNQAPLYYYEYVTDDKLTRWKATGREDVVGCGINFRTAEDVIALSCLYQELIRSGIDGRLDATEAGSAVKAILHEDENPDQPSIPMADKVVFDATSLFLDCLSILTEGSTATPALTTMMVATGIAPLKMRLELDSTLLESLGLIRNTFVRMGIRQQTNSLYRQSNYNLLREETEGYSKLLTEFFTTSGNEPPTSEVVEATFERVKGMIGAFDLDVGRVLDITLDVFANVLVKQYRFFVKYLRASSWWPQDQSVRQSLPDSALGPLPKWALPGRSGQPLDDEEKEAVSTLRAERDRAFWDRSRVIGIVAFFELGGREATDSALTAAAEDSSGDLTQDNENRKWIEITRTLPPPGNKVAAQVLGFKLRFYSSSARDSTDILPANLIYLAALLIKIGFISLRDLYPHIWPADPKMEDVRAEKMKEKAEREKLNRPGGGAINALLAAAPLPDDTIEGKIREAARLRELEATRRHPNKGDQPADRSTPTAQLEEKAEELPEPSEQKVQLLKSLLCIGALPEALYMLGRFPWLPDAFPELPEYIHRILHHSLSKIYDPIRPLQNQPDLRASQNIPDPDQSGATKGQVKLIDAPPRKTMRWPQLDKEDTNEAIDYKFYWDDWADNVPVCQSVDDVFTLCSTLLNLTGVKIGQDSTLLIKLARIGVYSLAQDTSDSNMGRWIDLSKRLLAPALSFTKCNPGVVNEVFELLNRFPTPTRYSIYAEWNSGQTSRLPDMKSAFDQAKAETKDVLKRISKTTIKPMARALAKVAYANPGIVFQVAIAQMESYENIVDAVVECARYFTFLAYDVLTWSLISALGSTGRNRVQADGMLTSKWLAALSLFAGKALKRYSVLTATPVVQYVADQLRRGNSTDLIILEEITKSMAGIISDTNFNEAQIMAMAGGELLQAQTLLQVLDRRHDSKTTAKRLMKSLTESRLAGQILVSLAQERQTGIFRIEEQDAHPKLLGNLFDQIHRILVQYLDLLRSNLSVEEFDAFVPDVARLIADFGIDPSIAFWISRPSINASVLTYDAEIAKPNSDSEKPPAKENAEEVIDPETTTKDLATAVDDSKVVRSEDAMDLTIAPVDGQSGAGENDAADKDTKEVLGLTGDSSATVETTQQLWHPVLQSVMDSIRPVLPEETHEIIGLPFYVAFWHLSLSDLGPPMASYAEEETRLTKKIQAINSDRSDISVTGTKKKEKEKEAINELSARMRAECSSRVTRYIVVRNRNLREKNHWFAGLWGKWDTLNDALIEHCFFPRMVISPLDALYTFRMLTFLHSNGTTNFRTVKFLDHFFREKRLTSMMFLCSAKEAENLGRFISEILRMLGRWHADKSLFEKEAYGTKKQLLGFATKMSKDKSQVAYMDYEDFRRVLQKWHRFLTITIKACITSGEYMHIRNAVNVLNNIHQTFPAVNWMGSVLLTSITNLSKSETREDLKVAALSVMGALKRREKEWVLPQAFCLAQPENSNSMTNGARSASAKPSTPQPNGDTAKALNPTAPDFRPNSRVPVNGLPKVDGSTDKVDAEDGEIEDAKMSDAPISTSAASNSGQSSNIPGKDIPVRVEPRPPAAISETSKMEPKESPIPASVTNDTSLRVSNTEAVATTPPVHTLPPPRPDMSRAASSSYANERPPHNLPNKPEPPQGRLGGYHIPPRTGERLSHDHPREPRYPERIESRDRGFERPASSSYAHSNERLQGMDRDRIDQRWNNDRVMTGRSGIDDRHNRPRAQDPSYSARDDRLERPLADVQNNEQHRNRRDVDSAGQQSRDTGMPPPRANVSQHPINPERAALIQGGQTQDRGQPTGIHPDRRPDPLRYDKPARSERTSRGPSPARTDERYSRYEGRREDPSPMHGRRPVEDGNRVNPPRFDDSQAPTGPRTGRPASTGPGPLNSNDRFRESMKPSPIAPPLDPNHGRLSQEPSFFNRQAESQYGRLTSDNDIPSGPRISNGNHPAQGRGGRNITAPQPRINTQLPSQNHGPATPVLDRQAPSGPSMRGSPRKPAPFPQHTTNSSAPPTPAAQSPDTASIHPDRLKALQGSGAVAAEDPPQNRGGPRQDPPPLPLPPRGPNNHQLPSPIGPSSNNRGPPTGPAMPNDRNGRDKRTIAGIQTVLQQASGPTPPERSGQGASIRGRGGRANNVNGPSPATSAPPTPSFPNMPRQDQPAPREDLFAGNPNGFGAPQQPGDDTFYSRGGRRGGPRDGPRDGERRSGRLRSRSPGKDRSTGSSMRVRDDDMPQSRDGLRDRPRGNEGPLVRDIRGGPGPLEASIRGNGGPPRNPHERGPPRDMRRTGRDDGQFRDRRGEPDMREGPPDRRVDRDMRDGGGSGRKRGRAGDEGQGERNFSDTKRIRR